jgi:hypothetical protein
MWNPRILLFRSLLLTSICTLVACGAGSDLPKARMGPGGGFQKQSGEELKRIPLNAALLDGELSVPSDQDVAELSAHGKLPLSKKEDSGRNYITFSDSDKNTGSNLIFRAIHQIPPKESITKVKKLELRLSGVNLFVPASLPDPDLTQDPGKKLNRGQVLCLLDGGACIGSREGLDVSGTFMKSAKQLEGDWLSDSDFSRNGKLIEKKLDGGDMLVSASGELVVDLLKHLKVDEAKGDQAAIDFIYDHSEEYSDAENGYRKFRFAMGGRVFAASGKLLVEFETDPALVPAQFESKPALPKKGASDQVYTKDQVKLAEPPSGLEASANRETSAEESHANGTDGDASKV